MNKVSTAILFCCVAFLLIAATAHGAPVLTIDIPRTTQSGDWWPFTFTSNEDIASNTAFAFRWLNEDKEGNRANRCLIAQPNNQPGNTPIGQLFVGQNRRARFCYLTTEPNHGSTTTRVAEITNPDACNNGAAQAAFTITTKAAIAKDTKVQCYLESSLSQPAPQDSKLIPLDATKFTVGPKSKDTFSITPTVAEIHQIRRLEGADPWAFKLVVSSSRTGMIRLQTAAKSRAAFDTSIYTDGPDGSYWCGGKIARVVANHNNQFLHDIWLDFTKANTQTTCIFRLTPRDGNLFIEQEEMYLLMHQQPLQTVFKVQQEMLPYQAISQLSRATDAQTFGSWTRISFPIPPKTATGTEFKLRFRQKDGSLNPTTFLAAATVTASATNTVTVSGDSLIVGFAGTDSPAWQYVSVTVELKAALAGAEDSKINYNVEVSTGGVVQNSKNLIAFNFMTPMTHFPRDGTATGSGASFARTLNDTHGDFTAFYSPAFFKAEKGHYLRIGQAFTHTLAATGHSCNVKVGGAATDHEIVERGGNLYIIVDRDAQTTQKVEFTCRLRLTQTPEDTSFPDYRFNVQAFPKDFAIHNLAAIAFNQYWYTSVPYGAVALRLDLPTVPVPAGFEVQGDEDGVVVEPVEDVQDEFNLQGFEVQQTTTVAYSLALAARFPLRYGVPLAQQATPTIQKILGLIKGIPTAAGEARLQDVGMQDVRWFSARWHILSAGLLTDPGDTFPGSLNEATSLYQTHSNTAQIYWTLDLGRWNTTSAQRTALSADIKALLNTKIAAGELDGITEYAKDSSIYDTNSNSYPTWCDAGADARGLPGCIMRAPGEACSADAQCISQYCSPYTKTCSGVSSSTATMMRQPAIAQRFSTSMATAVQYSSAAGVSTFFAVVVAVVAMVLLA